MEREKNFIQEIILQKKNYTFKHYFLYLLVGGCVTLLGVNIYIIKIIRLNLLIITIKMNQVNQA